MIGMRLKTMNASKFFDSKKVMSKADKAASRTLRKFGRYVRQTARRSIRKRKKISAPGQPPSSHVGTLKKLIFWDYNPSTRNVVIGPLLHGNAVNDVGVARKLEEGGSIRLLKRVRASKTRVGSRRIRTKKKVFIKPRPYMGPAFKAEQATLPALLRNSIR